MYEYYLQLPVDVTYEDGSFPVVDYTGWTDNQVSISRTTLLPTIYSRSNEMILEFSSSSYTHSLEKGFTAKFLATEKCEFLIKIFHIVLIDNKS